MVKTALAKNTLRAWRLQALPDVLGTASGSPLALVGGSDTDSPWLQEGEQIRKVAGPLRHLRP